MRCIKQVVWLILSLVVLKTIIFCILKPTIAKLLAIIALLYLLRTPQYVQYCCSTYTFEVEVGQCFLIDTSNFAIIVTALSDSPHAVSQCGS